MKKGALLLLSFLLFSPRFFAQTEDIQTQDSQAHPQTQEQLQSQVMDIDFSWFNYFDYFSDTFFELINSVLNQNENLIEENQELSSDDAEEEHPPFFEECRSLQDYDPYSGVTWLIDGDEECYYGWWEDY